MNIKIKYISSKSINLSSSNKVLHNQHTQLIIISIIVDISMFLKTVGMVVVGSPSPLTPTYLRNKPTNTNKATSPANPD